jgi:hypothetical protein
MWLITDNILLAVPDGVPEMDCYWPTVSQLSKHAIIASNEPVRIIAYYPSHTPVLFEVTSFKLSEVECLEDLTSLHFISITIIVLLQNFE